MDKSPIAQAFKTFAWCGGTFLILLCGGLIVTYIGEIIQGTTKHGVASQLGLITFLCGLVFVGIKLIQKQLTERRAMKEINEEQLILSYAKANGGSLTMSAVALECKLGIADTKKAFERLALTGICRIDVTDAGELYYWFPTFATAKYEDNLQIGASPQWQQPQQQSSQQQQQPPQPQKSPLIKPSGEVLRAAKKTTTDR